MKSWSGLRKESVFILMAVILFAIGAACSAPEAQPNAETPPLPSPTQLPTPLSSPTQRATPVPSPTQRATPVPSSTPSATPVPTETLVPTPTPVPETRPPIFDHPRPAFLDQPVGLELDNLAECGEIRPAPILGGLAPGYPVAWCITETFAGGEDQQPESCLRHRDGLIQICTSIVVFQDGRPRIIADLEQLRHVFAPIESPDEALSYAVAVTGYQAKFEPEDYDDMSWAAGEDEPLIYEYFTAQLEDTHVVETGDGYNVYLFDFSPLSCSPHPVWSVPIQVTTDGAVSELEGKKVKLYQESNYWWCAD